MTHKPSKNGPENGRPVPRGPKGQFPEGWASGPGRPKRLVPRAVTDAVRSRADLWAYCAAVGANPFETLVDLMQHSKNETTVLTAAKELARYMLPTLKATEVELGRQTRDLYYAARLSDDALNALFLELEAKYAGPPLDSAPPDGDRTGSR